MNVSFGSPRPPRADPVQHPSPSGLSTFSKNVGVHPWVRQSMSRLLSGRWPLRVGLIATEASINIAHHTNREATTARLVGLAAVRSLFRVGHVERHRVRARWGHGRSLRLDAR